MSSKAISYSVLTMSSGFPVNCLATEAEALNSVFFITFVSRSISLSTGSSSSPFFCYQSFWVIMDFLSDLFHQFLICLILNHIIFFLLSNKFSQIPHQHQSMFIRHFYLSHLFRKSTCHHSYPPDLLYQIMSQHCLHIYEN